MSCQGDGDATVEENERNARVKMLKKDDGFFSLTLTGTSKTHAENAVNVRTSKPVKLGLCDFST